MITKKRPQPLDQNNKRVASCGEVARLQKDAKWKKMQKPEKKKKVWWPPL